MTTPARTPSRTPSIDSDGVETPGFWPWFFQRVSGFLLIGLVGVHMWMGHFSGLRDVIDGRQEELVLYEVVKLRLAQGAFVFVDFTLLALVLYHGLSGLRSVLLDWGPAARRSRGVSIGLLILGLATFAYGAWVLLIFIL